MEDTAWDWLELVIARGQRIPEPVEAAGYSGKLVVRLPKSLHKKAAYQAARDGVSLNQFIVASIAEQIGARAATYNAWLNLHATAFVNTTTIGHLARAETTLTRQTLVGIEPQAGLVATSQQTEHRHA